MNSKEVTIQITGTTHLDLTIYLDNDNPTRAEIEKALLRRLDDEPLAIYPDKHKILKIWKEEETDRNRFKASTVN